MEGNVRWTVKISRDADISVRSYLARKGMKKGDLSKFIEEAVRWRVFDQTVAETKASHLGLPAADIESAIDEALSAVRAERPGAANK